VPVLIYGRNAVQEALRGRRRVRGVLLAGGRPGEERQRLTEPPIERLGEAGHDLPPVRYMSTRELTAYLGTPDHQGMAAEVDPYPYSDDQELLESRTLLVALDEVQDPHNLGAVIRSAEATGAGVVMARHRAAEVTAAVVKASVGATEHAAVARVRNLSDYLAQAKKAGFWVYGAAVGSPESYLEQDYVAPTCFVLGSEGRGLGRRVASLCDVIVSLPLKGQVGSLNVSVCAGILLYEAVRQRDGRVGRGPRGRHGNEGAGS
jgi:23S rRNA (guanosine2251-2'-O)-methyltransferase